MTAERELESATERHALDRGDHWLARAFDRVDQVPEGRRLQHLWGVEFTNVGAGAERAVGTDQHDGLGDSVVERTLQRCHQVAPQRETQAVDGRILEREDRHGPTQAVLDVFHL